ncbi:MAG TPA: sigma 54-interacting transcriptional regulator [Candidatus Acidoferrum sp.]|nr:sigma 54-interacting transcriptional regulator [Candidatus Acidoferrum sp.]
MAESIAQHRDLAALFHDLAERLHAVVDFDFLTLVLHDPERNVMRLHILETRLLTPGKTGSETPMEGHPSGWVWQSQQAFVVSDTEEDERFPDFLQRLREVGVRSLAMVPLTTAQHRLGAMGFGRLVPQGITDTELQFMQRVGSQVAVAVDNALNFETSQAYQTQLALERDRLRVLLDVNNVLVSTRELSAVFSGIVTSLERVIHHDYTSLALLEPATGLLKIYALDFPSNPEIFKSELTVPGNESPAGRAIANGQPLVVSGAALDEYKTEVVRTLRAEGLQSICCIPLKNQGRTFGTLNLASRREDAFAAQDVELLQQVSAQIAIAVENALAFKQIDALKDKLAEEKLYLEEEIRSEFNFEEIVGDSPALKRALAQVELVAPAGTAVLITGETGTGKELIARAIHNLSSRRQRTFVKVNCAAIPGGLLESELFGHERGAFTGAIAQKIGRFELADKGTLFLDEVADLPLELQPKLLRVLQEQEFERLGSNRTQKVDVRIVAATNGDLAKLVAERTFRSDLYYRLNVFPIHIPALRERPEDVPLLVRYFVQKFSRRLNKAVAYVPAEAMEALASYSWPGNIRELENFLERAVLLSPGKELRVPVSELKANDGASLAGISLGGDSSSSSSFGSANSASSSNGSISTLEEAERQHILRALRQTEWRIAGPKGAAGVLGMKRTTLQARMRKLNIRRPI